LLTYDHVEEAHANYFHCILPFVARRGLLDQHAKLRARKTDHPPTYMPESRSDMHERLRVLLGRMFSKTQQEHRQVLAEGGALVANRMRSLFWRTKDPSAPAVTQFQAR
jgi:hypothetical protein